MYFKVFNRSIEHIKKVRFYYNGQTLFLMKYRKWWYQTGSKSVLDGPGPDQAHLAISGTICFLLGF